jgi:hypothetical protein
MADPMPDPSAAPQRVARVRPDATYFLHSLTAGVWYRVRDRNPEAPYPEALEGYLWIEVHGRLQHVWEKHVEVREEPG